MTKKELRKVYLEKRKEIKNSSYLSEQLSDKFFSEINLDQIKVIHFFLPIISRNEVDTWFIIRKLWKEYPHIKTVVPVSDFNTHKMLSIEITEDSKIEENKYGIPEPISGNEIDDRLIDLVLAPLLISDKNGFRVGYGKGFYDRFFTYQCNSTVVKIGLSFFKPIKHISDLNEHDVCLDYCLHLG